MHSVNIHEAKTHLSKLVEEAARGKVFVIAKAGKPLVMVVPYPGDDQPAIQRIGFMAGELSVPDDFDRMKEATIAELFEGKDR